MGNVYMEAEQIRFKNASYRDVQSALAAALEGGSGGGAAEDITYDNTESGLSAENVQSAIDEIAGDVSTLETTIGDDSSGLVKAVDDLETTVGDADSGLVKDVADLGSDIEDLAPNVYSSTEAVVGKWDDEDLYRKKITIGALPNNTLASYNIGITTETVHRMEIYYTNNAEYGPFPNNEGTASFNKSTKKLDVATSGDYSGYTGVVILEYTKAS